MLSQHSIAQFILLLLASICLASVCQAFIIKEDESFLLQPHYATQEDIEDLFARMEKAFPEHAKVETIGRSFDGRHLIVMQIGKNVRQRNLLTPMVKYIGNMHGDETIGRQLLVYLAQYLLYNYDTSFEVAQLVNTTDIFLMPTMNPDGFAHSQEGSCESLPNYVGRTNAAAVDLNRDFPDRLESQQNLQLRSRKRQPETAALIDWIVSKPFVLSANFHGGALVASYPYDNSIKHVECCEDSLTPDDRVFKLMAHTYADNHPLMRQGKNCNDNFTDGITNGAHWYELNGGMQDFNYAFTNCFELTIELSCCKYPPAETLPTEWTRNKRSLLQLLKLAHIGIKGLVKDAAGYPIHDASILVSGLEDKPIRTTQRGEYWRLLTPGIYNVQASAFGYQPSQPQQVHVTNENNEALRLDFTLTPIEVNYDGDFRKVKVIRAEAASGTAGGFLTPTKFEHHNYTAMERYLRDIADSYPSITRLYSIGKSVQHRDLWVMEIFATPGQHVPGVPEFKYVANMHGNEVVGREMLLLLTKYICELYLTDQRITTLVNTTRMHFLYSMNPDGYEVSKEGDRSSPIGRPNANNVDLNRNFPDQYGQDEYNRVRQPEVEAVMNWTLSIPFVLSANLHGGSLVANYPFDDNENDFKDPIARMRMALAGRKSNPTEEDPLFKHLASVYSNAHPTMHLGEPCPLFKHEIFPDGITNGAKWYSVTGGMQDWNYVYAGVLETTIEMGCDKFPMVEELPKYWQDNREALLQYIEQVHRGVNGFVKSSISTPIPGAKIMLDGIRHATYSQTNGDYWKLSLPGRHNITVLADGFMPHREAIEILNDARGSLIHDVTLMRDDPQHWAAASDFHNVENVVNTRYHNNLEMRQRLGEFETKYREIAEFGYADNEFATYFNSIKLTSDIAAPEEGKFKILIVSSFFDTVSPLGREILMNLARHLIEGFNASDFEIQSLLRRSIIHILPLSGTFDSVFRIYNRNNSICDPIIGNALANSLLSPESEKRRDLFLQYLESERFDLMLAFTSGGSELNYPKDEEWLFKIAQSIESTEFSLSPLQCPNTATRERQRETTEQLTGFLYKMYNTPLFSLGLSCCRMPPQAEIASIWRKNLEKIKNFLRVIETGVSGNVQNGQGQPLRDAYILISEHTPIYNVTKNAARFQIILPAGAYELEVRAPNHEYRKEQITVTHGQIRNMGSITLSPISLITGHSEVHTQSFGSATSLVATATISGFVLDTSNHPIKGAKITGEASHVKHYLRNFTDSLGAFSISKVPPGDVTLKVEAPRHIGATRLVHIGTMGEPVRGTVFRLKVDERVLGMPRMLFIIIASILIIVGVVFCIICAQFVIARRQGIDRRYYNFSLLPQKSKELFEEDDVGEEGETELFRSPIKKGMSIQPYYDEENVDHAVDTDEYDDGTYDSGDEIIMLEKRTH